MTRLIFSSAAPLLTTAMLASACATGPYRVHKPKNTNAYVPLEKVTLQADDDYCKQICPKGKSSCQKTAASLEVVVDENRSEMYRLAYVEFDDQGLIWSPQQIDDGVAALTEIQEKGQSVILVSFVHGWRHNASVCDGNVKFFREVLGNVARLERGSAVKENRAARAVMGLYLGWRGRTAKGPSLAFNARKRGTERMGRGDLLWVLDRFSYQFKKPEETSPAAASQMITIGHSLGAAVLHNTVKTHIEREMLTQFSDTELTSPFGDLVVYINPAFSAIEYNNFYTQRRRYLGTKTLLLTLAVEGDSATRRAYPVSLGFMYGKGRYRHRDQRKRARTTLGNYPNYYTHNFVFPEENATRAPGQNQPTQSRPGPAEKRAIVENKRKVEQVREDRLANASSFEELIEVRKTDNNILPLVSGKLVPVNDDISNALCEPFVVVYDKHQLLMGDHNDIFTPSMQLFLTEYLTLLKSPTSCPRPEE